MPDSSKDDQHSSSSKTWLNPQLIIQIVTIVVTVTLAWATLSNRLDQMQERLMDIRQQLPNKELYDERMGNLQRELADLKEKFSQQDTWIRNTRERLAEKGWRP